MYNILFYCVIFRMNRLVIVRICLMVLFVLYFLEVILLEFKVSVYINGIIVIDKKGNNLFVIFCIDNY